MEWNKFHPIFGSDLKVGFETTFSETVLDIDPLYEKSGLIYRASGGGIIKIYEPAIEVRGSCVDGDAAQIFFEPVSPVKSLFRRLVFARKINHRRRTKKSQRWMVAARHGEFASFGFDDRYSLNERYLSLAYPGVSREFVPIYFKIQNGGGDFVYLEVWAFDEGKGKNIIAQARRVPENMVPEQLILAEPNGTAF